MFSFRRKIIWFCPGKASGSIKLTRFLDTFLAHSTCSVYDDNGYPHDGRADKDPYPHDRRADKDSYPHDSNNQCIILRLQLSFAMINVQLMLV